MLSLRLCGFFCRFPQQTRTMNIRLIGDQIASRCVFMCVSCNALVNLFLTQYLLGYSTAVPWPLTENGWIELDYMQSQLNHLEISPEAVGWHLMTLPPSAAILNPNVCKFKNLELNVQLFIIKHLYLQIIKNIKRQINGSEWPNQKGFMEENKKKNFCTSKLYNLVRPGDRQVKKMSGGRGQSCINANLKKENC